MVDPVVCYGLSGGLLVVTWWFVSGFSWWFVRGLLGGLFVAHVVAC